MARTQIIALRDSIFRVVLVALMLPSMGSAEETTNSLADLSIEELMEIEVYSVSKRDKKIQDSATAVYVISAEDIRRSGATSLPEALRLAPGLQVTRVNANTWSIAARGFAGVFSNKLLVMIDGRTVYRPVFSGTFWDQHLIPLSDVKQIEVIRGPGATVWGANAVNGVINIIRKTASETKGTSLTAGVGSLDGNTLSAQQGVTLSDNWDLKLYANEHTINSFERSGESARDNLNYLGSGFRTDGRISDKDTVIVQGDIYRVDSHERQIIPAYEPPYSDNVSAEILDWGTNLVSSWTQSQSDSSSTTLQLYYDRFQRSIIPVKIVVNTIDADFQHDYALNQFTELSYGFNWRLINDYIEAGESASFDPASRTLSLFTTFAQTEFALSESVLLTLGSKFEHNDFTGFEIQPSARILWHVDDNNSLWFSVARAVRTPSRTAKDLQIDLSSTFTSSNVPNVIMLKGNPDIQSENLLAVELGERAIFSDCVSLDVASFINIYDDLSAIETNGPAMVRNDFSQLLLTTPSTFQNAVHGVTYGAEASLTVKLVDWWKVAGSYSWLKLDLSPSAGHTPLFATTGYSETVENVFNIRSQVDLNEYFEFDTFVYYVDRPIQDDVPSFVRTDFRVGWKATENVDVSIVLQNAFDGSHKEAEDPFASGLSSEIERSLFGYVRVQL